MAKKKTTATPAARQEIPLGPPSPARDDNPAKVQEEESKVDEDIVADMIGSEPTTLQDTEGYEEVGEDEEGENDLYTLGGEG